jgi:hypothetical protein
MAPAAMVVFVIGFVIVGGLLPPPSPSLTGEQLVRFYAHNTNGIRLGLALTMLAGALTAPFVGAITVQMRRIEGEWSPLAYTQLGTGMLGVLLFAIPMMILEAAVFRPNRDPQILQAISDVGWIMLVATYGCVFVQCCVVGVCILQDTEARVYPRWLAYFNFWVALLFIPDTALYFFKTGLFAWDGLLVWWIPLTVFFGWFMVMFAMSIRALNRVELTTDEGTATREPLGAAHR